ncbi:hypothetical protein ACP4OV_010411 [Aristida adscensionis]
MRRGLLASPPRTSLSPPRPRWCAHPGLIVAAVVPAAPCMRHRDSRARRGSCMSCAPAQAANTTTSARRSSGISTPWTRSSPPTPPSPEKGTLYDRLSALHIATATGHLELDAVNS